MKPALSGWAEPMEFGGSCEIFRDHCPNTRNKYVLPYVPLLSLKNILQGNQDRLARSSLMYKILTSPSISLSTEVQKECRDKKESSQG